MPRSHGTIVFVNTYFVGVNCIVIISANGIGGDELRHFVQNGWGVRIKLTSKIITIYLVKKTYSAKLPPDFQITSLLKAMRHNIWLYRETNPLEYSLQKQLLLQVYAI